MSLQIITGDMRINKKQVIIEKIVNIVEQQPNARVFYIVPDHIKFEMESMMLETISRIRQSEVTAMMQIQVASFSRLAWYLVPELMNSKNKITNVGVAMLIRQAITLVEKDLTIYRGQVLHQRFADQLTTLFDEFITGNIRAQDMLDFLKNQSSTQADPEHRALYDIALIYQQFEQLIAGYDLADFQIYQVLHQYLSQNHNHPPTYIVIDHYDYLNAQELNITIAMAQCFDQVWVNLGLDQTSINQTHWQPLSDLIKRTYRQLKILAHQLSVEIDPDWQIDGPPFKLANDIIQIATAFKEGQASGYPKKSNHLSNHHQVVSFPAMVDEVRFVANKIHYLVHAKGYRYQDILVLTRDLDRYQHQLAAYFELNDIPYFYDQVNTMNQHPLMVYIKTILHLIQYRFKERDVKSLLKSPLLLVDLINQNDFDNDTASLNQERIHQLNLYENILLANGYFGYRYANTSFEWQFPEAEQPYINHLGQETDYTIGDIVQYLRDWIHQHVVMNIESISYDQSMSGRDFSEWLYTTLQMSGVDQTMIIERDRFIEQGQLDCSLQYEQVWDNLMTLLDEFYMIYANQTLPFSDFAHLLVSGMDQATYHIIPATLDQVMVTSIESPQIKPAKILFVLGLDDHDLPLKQDRKSLVSDKIRTSLQDYLLPHQYLLNLSQYTYASEPFLAYRMLLQGQDMVYITYSQRGDDTQYNLSPFIDQLVKAGYMTVQKVNQLANPFIDLGRAPMNRNYLIRRFQQNQWQAFDQLVMQITQEFEHQQGNQQLARLINQLNQPHQLPTQISRTTALALYGENMQSSVSKIETFYSDPFSYFLIYGLKLQERLRFDSDARLTGDYFHESLDRLMAYLVQEQINIKDLSTNQLNQLLEEVFASIDTDYAYQIYTSHPQFEAIAVELKKQLRHVSQLMRQQQTVVETYPFLTEAVFGQGYHTRLKGLTYPLSHGGTLAITGKIDRLDYVGENKKLLQVIDYKSRPKSFNLENVYYGLDLQLLTYMTVAQANFPQLNSLGGFYQGIIQKIEKGTEATLNGDQAATYSLTKRRLSGFILTDEANMQAVDSSLQPGSASLVYPINLIKKGTYGARNLAFTSEQAAILTDYLHHLLVDAAERLYAGDIRMQPFYENQYTTSLTYPYRVISGFDGTKHYQAYRHRTIKSDQAFAAIKERLAEKGVNHVKPNQ